MFLPIIATSQQNSRQSNKKSSKPKPLTLLTVLATVMGFFKKNHNFHPGPRNYVKLCDDNGTPWKSQGHKSKTYGNSTIGCDNRNRPT